jgi:hypothetical protein
MFRFLKKPTLLSILCFLGIPFFFFMTFYALTWKGGESLYAVGYFVIVLILSATYFIDRILTNYINNKKASLYEFIFLIVAIPSFLFINRQVYIELNNNNENFIAIIENPGNLENGKYTIEYPFNKIIKTKDNYFIIDKIPENIYFISPESWSGSYCKSFNFSKYKKIEVYYNSNGNYYDTIEINESFIDSLINKKNRK